MIIKLTASHIHCLLNSSCSVSCVAENSAINPIIHKIIATINTGNIIRESNKKRLIKSKDGKVVIGVKQKGLHG